MDNKVNKVLSKNKKYQFSTKNSNRIIYFFKNTALTFP